MRILTPPVVHGAAMVSPWASPRDHRSRERLLLARPCLGTPQFMFNYLFVGASHSGGGGDRVGGRGWGLGREYGVWMFVYALSVNGLR